MIKIKNSLLRKLAVWMAVILFASGFGNLSLNTKAAEADDEGTMICSMDFAGISAGDSVATGNTGFSRVVGTNTAATESVVENDGEKYGTFSVSGGDASTIQALYYKTYDYDDVCVNIRMRINDYNGKFTWQFRLGYDKVNSAGETVDAQETVQMLVLNQGELSFMGNAVDVSSWAGEGTSKLPTGEWMEFKVALNTVNKTASLLHGEETIVDYKVYSTNDKVSRTHTANEFRLVVQNLSQENTSVDVDYLKAIGRDSDTEDEESELLLLNIDFSNGAVTGGTTSFGKVVGTGETATATANLGGDNTYYASFGIAEGDSKSVIQALYYKAFDYDTVVLRTKMRIHDSNGTYTWQLRMPYTNDAGTTVEEVCKLLVVKGRKLTFLGKSASVTSWAGEGASKLPLDQWLEFTVVLNTKYNTASLLNGETIIMENISYTSNTKVSRANTGNNFRFVAQSTKGQSTTADVDYFTASAVIGGGFDPWSRIELTKDQETMVSQIMDSLKDENLTHPYLYFTEDDLPELRSKITSGNAKEAYTLLEQEANTAMEEIKLDEYTFSTALSGRKLQKEIGNLTFYSYLAEKQEYKDLAAELLLKAATEVSAAQAANLNDALAVGDFLHAFALGYDWLYNDFTDSERETVEKALVEYATWIFDNSFNMPYGNEEEKRLVWNWNSVTHGALGIAAMVLEESVIAENEIDREAWLGRTIQRMDGYCTYSKDATGMSHEGMSYLGYGMHSLIPWAVGIKELTGVNWLDKFDHLKEVPGYLMWMNAPGGDTEALYLNQGTINTHFSTAYYLINLFRDQEGLWGFNKTNYFEYYYEEKFDWTGNGYQLPQIIIFEDQELAEKEPEEDDLFKVFEKGVVVGRDGWDDTDAMFTFTSAWGNKSTWNHPDTNTFGFWAKGENFIVDLGAGYTKGRQHNIVMIDGNGLNAEGGSTLCEGELKIAEDYGNAVYALGDAVKSYTKTVKAETANRHIVFGRGEEPYVFTYDDFSVEAEGEHKYSINYFTKSYNSIELLEDIQGARIDGGKNNGLCYVLFFDDDTVQVAVAEEDANFRYLSAEVNSEQLGLGALFLAADADGKQPVVEQVMTDNGMKVKLYLSDNRLDVITVDNGAVSYESTVYMAIPEGENVIDLSDYAPEGKPDDPTDPSDPTEPSEPTDPSEPTEPSEPDEPSEPTDPSEPREPSDTSGSDESTDGGDTTSSDESDEVNASSEDSTDTESTPSLENAADAAAPNTGDNSNVLAWLSSFTITVAGLGVAFGIFRRKQRKRF